MVRFAAYVVLLAGTLLACGCAGRQTPDSTADASQEWRLKNLEEKALVFQNAQLELASRMADVEGRLDALEQGGARLGEQDLPPVETAPEPLMTSGALPEPGPATPAAEAAPEAPAADHGHKWDDYPDATAKAADGKPAAVPEPAKTAAAKPAAKPMKYAVKAPAKAAEKAPAGKAAYDKALALVLSGKTAEGRAALESFLAKHPGGSLEPNAQYWLGESYYHEKRFPESIVAFKKVHQEHPKHPKAAAALLKIGYAYDQLGDTSNARFYLDVLLQDYPRSEPAPMARKRLDSLAKR